MMFIYKLKIAIIDKQVWYKRSETLGDVLLLENKHLNSGR